MKAARITSLIQWTGVLLAALLFASCGGNSGDRAVGTVIDANRSAADNAFTATLTGAQQVPGNASSAVGAGSLIVDANSRSAKATVATAGIAGTAANIHDAAPGSSGPIVFPLSETSPGAGVWTAQVTLSDAQLNALQAGNYYFSVQSAATPAGEIRGQILARLSTPPGSGVNGAGTTAAGNTVATVFKNALTGSQVTPSASTTATGIATAAVDHAANTLTAVVNTIGLTGTEAHIHEGAPGQNGAIVSSLAETPAGSGIWVAKINVSDSQINSIMDGGFYVDVHSASFPGGEIRGQIAQLHRRTGLHDCRFGGFGFDDCTFDGTGLFLGFGFGFGGFGSDGFINGDPLIPDTNGFEPGAPGFGFDGFESGPVDSVGGGFTTDGGGVSPDMPAPGIIF